MPAVLAILAFASGIFSGYFDAKREKLEADKTRLENQISDLKVHGLRMVSHLEEANRQLKVAVDGKIGHIAKISEFINAPTPNIAAAKTEVRSAEGGAREIEERIQDNLKELTRTKEAIEDLARVGGK